MPFELVDGVLEEARAVQRRVRVLPSRVGVYFVLAMALFPGLGYVRVWDKLVGALAPVGVARPSEKALRDLRRRVGVAPVKALFEAVAVPLAPPWVPGVAYRGLRTVAFDGLNSVKVPDSERNRLWLGKFKSRVGLAGYPAVRIVMLAETGTRGLLGAVTGSRVRGGRHEAVLARRLVPLLGKGMLVLADRAYDSGSLLTAIAATGAMFLCRGRSSRKPPVLRLLGDGSYLSDLGGLPVRIIEADLQVTGTGGAKTGDRYRLITTLLDHRRYPATELVQLYHERWEIEVAYLALRHTLLGGHVLRSKDRPGAEQELWALLTVYQLLRTAMADAAAARPGTDPDRASFTSALQAARDQVTAAQGITHAGPGRIHHAILNTLLPPRRRRYSARKTKCPTSRYHHRDDSRPSQATTITHIHITITTPPPDRPAHRAHHPRTHPPAPMSTPRPHTRRHKITQIMTTHPHHDWAGHDLATLLHIPPRNMLTQLAEWARHGYLTKTTTGRYTLPQPP